METGFRIIFGLFVAEDLVLWLRGAHLLRKAPFRLRSRLAFHGFMAFQLFGIVLVCLAWIYRNSEVEEMAPRLVWVVLILWHILVAPVALVANTGGMICGGLASIGGFFFRRFRHETQPPALGSGEAGVTRRQFLGASATLAPPIVTFALSGVAFRQLSEFRVRRLVVTLPQLPRELDGMTIAHVSDTHLGHFTNGRIINDVSETTNALKPDLVFFTGDLIDTKLRWLGPGIEMLRAIEAPLVICEGNHDLLDGARRFEAGVKASGLSLLVNEAETLEVRGVPVQVLGLRWTGPENWQHGGGERALALSVRRLLQLRDPRAFHILAAHHPHAWDYAEDIPLTLSGHTHGGQLMINERLGVGPMMFRYWSGLYTRPIQKTTIPQALVVSNGVGNWFPIRISAPAEIVHITLRST